MESQNFLILAHLVSGQQIDAITALERFGVFRLASRINELRKSHNIKTNIVTKNKKRYASYEYIFN